MVEKFNLEWLDNRTGSWRTSDELPTFFAGYEVQARVCLKLSKPMKVAKIFAEIHGKSTGHWTVNEWSQVIKNYK